MYLGRAVERIAGEMSASDILAPGAFDDKSLPCPRPLLWYKWKVADIVDGALENVQRDTKLRFRVLTVEREEV